jgi:hypothetical protein
MKKFLLLKTLSTLFFFLVAAYLGKTGQSTDATTWYYATAGIIGFLIFSCQIVNESMTAIDRFVKISMLAILPLVIVFLLSTTGCFDGPYAAFCGWPIFTIIMTVMFFNLVISAITTICQLATLMGMGWSYENLDLE